jgi:general secretion pathway protein G
MITRRNNHKSLAREGELTVVRAAFTLMEMLVVVAIIVALAGLAIYAFLPQLENSKKKAAQVKATTLSTAAKNYYIDHGQYPGQLQLLLKKDDKGGPYIDNSDALKDPWGNEFQYNASATNVETGEQQPEISTRAPDGTTISNLKH